MKSHPAQDSPLDPFLVNFLVAVSERENGFLAGTDSKLMASKLEIERAFLDMLFTSARTRGLLKPAYGRGSKIVWNVSMSGQELISRHGGTNEADAPTD